MSRIKPMNRQKPAAQHLRISPHQISKKHARQISTCFILIFYSEKQTALSICKKIRQTQTTAGAAPSAKSAPRKG
jgi:hypothetical protein